MAKKKAEKAADKALKKAKDAVAQAKRRAKKVDGKAKRRAKKVESDLKALLARGKKNSAKPAEKKAPAATLPPVEKVAPAPVAEAPAATEDLNALTVVQLRARARDKGIAGYGKLTKAQLVAALKD